METVLLVASAALGLIVPFLFTHALTRESSRAHSPATKTRFKAIAVAAVGGWTLPSGPRP